MAAPNNRGGGDNLQTMSDAVRELSRLRSQFGADTDLGRGITDAVRDLNEISKYQLAGPELQERIRREVLPNLEALELQLRHKVDAQNAGQVRNPATDPVPPGYADRVAEYFRKLSKSK